MILDSIYDITCAWEVVKPSILLNLWRKLYANIKKGKNKDATCPENEEVPLCSVLVNLVKTVTDVENIDEINLKEWLNCDNNNKWFEHMTDEEILGRETEQQRRK